MKEEQPKKRGHFARSKYFYITIGILMLVAATIYVAKDLEIQRIEARHQHRLGSLKDSLNLEKTALIEHAREIMDSNNQEQLSLMMKTLVWAVRSDLLKNNQDQVNQYLLQMIKEPNVEVMMVIDTGGTILLSSNKKEEEQQFGRFYKENYLTHDDIYSTYEEDGSLHLSAPIMSFNSRLGTVFLIYHPSNQIGE